MAYKSKYLEASKKRLNGDNPNNIDKKAIDERIKRSEEEWARNRKKMAKYHTPEAKVTNRYKDARSGFEALQYNPSLDTSTYDKFYKEYQKSANDYKELLKKEERKAIANMLNPFDDVKKEKAFSNYRDSKSKLKAAKKEEYEQKQNFNTQLLKNKTIAGYAKAIVDNEELRKKSYFTENGQLEPYQEYLYTTSTQKAVEAEKQLEKLNINISDLTDTYRRSKSVQQQKDIAKFANDNPVLASALSVMGTMDVKSNVGALAQTAGEGVKSVITDEYVPVDNGTDTFIASRASNTIRSTVYQKIYEYYGGGLGMDEFNGTEPSEETKKENEKKEILSKVVPELYQTGMSMLDSAVSILMPGKAGSVMLALNAGASSANEMAEREINASNAFGTSGLAAVWEGVFEARSIGNLKKMSANVLDPIIKNVAKQMLTEGSEELFTEIANIATDTIINQDDSNLMNMYNYYTIEKEYTDKEAKKEVVKQLGSQALKAAIGGAISGGLFGAAGGTISKIHRNSNYKNAGELLKESGASAIDAEIQMGLNADEKSKEHKLATQMQNKLLKNPVENRTNGFDYSSINKKKLGELRIRNSRAIFKNNVMEYIGDTKENKKIKKVLNDMGKGLPITEKQANIIQNNDKAIEAINQELDAEYKKEDFTADMLTSVSNLLATGEIEVGDIIREKITPTNNFQPKEIDTAQIANNYKKPRSTYINPKDCVIPATDTFSNQNVGISNTRPISKKGDNVMLLTNNGEIDYGDVDIADAETKKILDFVAQSDIIGDTGANTIFVNYNKRNESVNTDTYLNQADLIYQAGLANEMSFDEYITSNPIYKPISDLLGKGAEYIYNSGQTDKRLYDEQQQARKKEKPAPSRKGTGSYNNKRDINNDNVKYSLADNFDSEFDKAVKGDKYYKNNVFVIGKMPNLYGEFGINTSLNLTITSKHLKNAVKPKNITKHYHGLSKETLKNAVLKLDSPAFVSFNDNGVLYVTVSETDSDNVPITFVVKPNGTVQIEQKRVKSNHSLSIYGKENTYNFLNKQYSDNKMLSINKNEATLVEQVLGKQFSDQLINSDFTDNIAEYKNIVNTHSMQSETEYSSDIEDVLKILADVTGYDYETVSDKDTANGHIVHSLAKVVINEATGKEYQTAIHENLHYVAEYNTEDYKKLKNALLDWYKNSWSNDADKNTKFNNWKNEYKKAYNSDDNPMTSADIEEEMVADAISALFTTDEGVQQFAEYVAHKPQKEQNGIVQAFKDLVNKIVEQIKKALKRADLTTYQQDYLQMEQQQAENIRSLFLEALDKASENYKSGQKNNTTNNSDVKMSLKFTQGQEWENQIKNYLKKNGKIKHSDTLYFGISKELGIDIDNNLDFGIPIKVISKSQSAKNADHKISDDTLINLKKGCKDCVAYIVNNDKNTLLVLTNINENGKPVAITFRFNEKFDGDILNLATSIHTRSNVEATIRNVGKEGIVYIKNKNKFEIMAGDLKQYQALNIKFKFVENNVSQSETDVNTHSMQNDTKYSIDTENKGRGYVGKSMSVNAHLAYASGEMPLSKWNKSTLIDEISNILYDSDNAEYINDISKLTLKELQDNFLKYSSWHHTGMNYNVTKFYEIDENSVNEISKKTIENIVAKRQPKTVKTNSEKATEKLNKEALSNAKTIYNKLNVIFESGVTRLKTLNGVVNKYLNGNLDVDKTFDEAITLIVNNDKNRIEQWRKLPEEHYRHKDVSIYDNNPIEYVLNKFSVNTINNKYIQSIKKVLLEQNDTKFSLDVDHKEKQFEVIQKTNPADDDYHTWIRSADEIKTLEEAFNDDDYAGYETYMPDYTAQMAKEAMKNGKITVFSSYPIKNGVFVTPSMMEARSYSGNGRVYKLRANINDIAWIDVTQGQYAKTDDVKFSKNVNVDEFNSMEYNVVDITYDSHYKNLKSEIMTWDADKHLDEIRYRLGYIYKMTSDDDRKVFLYIPKTSKAKNYVRKLRDSYVKSNGTNIDETFEYFDGQQRRSSDNNDVIFRRKRGKSNKNDRVDTQNAQSTEKNNSGRFAENDNNDFLSEKKSIDVDISDYKKVLRENKKLKELNQHLKEEFELTHGRKANMNSARILAKRLKESFDTTMTIDELAKEIVAMSNDFGSVENDTLRNWDDLFNASRKIAQKMYDNQKQGEIPEDIKSVLNDIRKPRISLSEMQKESVAYAYDSYHKFRQTNFGKVNYTNDGIPLDTQWQEWAEIYPEWFDKDVAEPDMPLVLNDIVDTLRSTNDNKFGFSPDEAILSLTYDIADAYFNLPTRQTFADKKQKEIDQLRKENRERLVNAKAASKRKYDKAINEVKALKKNIRDIKYQNKQALIQMRKEEREKLKKSADRRKVMESIKRNMLRLSTLAKQDKKKHIPNDMIEAIRDLITSITFDNKTDIYVAQKIRNLDMSFRRLADKKDSQYAYLTDMYSEYIKKQLDAAELSIDNKPVRDMTFSELVQVDNLIKMTLQSINYMNKLYGQERNQSLEESAGNVIDELTVLEKTPYKDKVVIDSLKYGSMKPIYFFNYLGSDEFTNRFLELRNGEDKWAVTVSNSRNYALSTREKHDWRNWNNKKQYKVELMNGEVLHLNLQQIMSIYAMSRREQTKNHIIHGGLVIVDKPKKAIDKVVDKATKKETYQFNDKYNHTINEFDLAKIVGMLTDEQRAYVRDMTDYLSNEMAEKGNEVSRQLYDVELFKEQNYFPARTAKNYMHRSSKDTIDSRKIINSGFTNATLEHAENPLLLEEFDDVWASHVDDMAQYNAFAIPLENFDRIYNYEGNAGNDYVSLRSKIENIYGKAANEYIEKLLKDLNGNVIFEPGTDIVNKAVGLFKKSAVFASASVVVQQPSAIGRAISEVDIKYFGKTTLTKRDYEEVKKYAPIAIIKEMGYFDTNMAKNTVDYLNSLEYNKFGEKFKGFWTDGSYRDEVFSYTASKADEITWAHIWNACKAETKDKYSDLSNEEMLEKAGERFTEVVTKTQVYDSVFSRSGLMRSKNGAVQMATSFMAEPTTSLNMLANAIVQSKRGKMTSKQVRAALGSLFIASVINALLQTLVTAARDDDDDKTYAEKYLSQLFPNFIDNINPLNQIAFIKDVISLIKGYDVTRADMSVFSDLINAVRYLSSDKLTLSQKMQRLAGAVGALFGLPAKNILRDINGVVNIAKGIKSDNSFSFNAAGEAFQEEIADVLVTDDLLYLFGLDLIPEKDKEQKIYEAVLKGDDEMYRRLADNLDNPDTYVKNGLIANDIRVAEAGLKYAAGDVTAFITTAESLKADGFDYELALKSIKGYASALKTAKTQKTDGDDESYSNTLDKLLASGIDKDELETAIDSIEIAEKSDKESKLYSKDDLLKAVENGNQDIIDTIIQSNIDTDIANGKTEEEARKTVKSSLLTTYKQFYIESHDSERLDIENKLSNTGLFDDTDYTEWKAEAYITEAMAKAFNSNDTATIKKYVSDRVKAKVENGMEEKNAVFGIKTSISNQYKQKFINGNADTKAEIITIMTKTGIYGSRTDVIAYINKYWLN